jgi:signal transduction histidine kinase
MEKSILLVDDEEGIRKVLAMTLTDMGYDVLTSDNGKNALLIFKKVKPLIVISDIKMPEMDGIDFLRMLKQENPETQVIMITGHGDIDLAIKSVKYDATDFITKPINNEFLEIALKRAQERIAIRNQLKEYTLNLEQLVREKTKKLIETERMAAIGQTIMGLNHAIKNIASGLKGGEFVLEKGIEMNNRKYLIQGWEMIKGNVEKITTLSLDLLDYAKPTEINYQICDPNLPVREVADLMKFKAKELDIELSVDLCPVLKKICFDPELIHRCLLNLLANALDSCKNFTPNTTNRKKILIKTVHTSGWGVEYQVIDNCCGMSQDIKDKLYKGIFTTKGSCGTGIGLMITKKIIDEHKGSIEVLSEEGTGSTFIIKIPEGPPIN